MPTFCDANVKLVGARVTAGALPLAPVPVRGTVCGLPVALSVMLMLAVRVPVADGVNVMPIVHFALTAMGEAQLSDSVKSAAFVPVMKIEVSVSATLPVLVSVTVCCALVV